MRSFLVIVLPFYFFILFSANFVLLFWIARVRCLFFFFLRPPGFSDALRLQSNSPDVLTLRGLVLFLCGRLPQALQHAQSALRYDPGHEPAQRLRKRVKDVERLKEEGNRAFKLGQLHEALSRYTDALEVRSRPLHPYFQTSRLSPASRRERRRGQRRPAPRNVAI